MKIKQTTRCGFHILGALVFVAMVLFFTPTYTCSSFAFGTLVQIDAATVKVIEEISVGDTVYACGKDLVWQKYKVVFSQGTTGESWRGYVVVRIEYLDRSLLITSDHVFLMADGMLKRADRLVVGDELMSPEGKSVGIQSVTIGVYTGSLYQIATTIEALPDANLTGHLLNTNGAISGDYVVQISMRIDELKGKIKGKFLKSNDDLPAIGSPASLPMPPSSRTVAGSCLRACCPPGSDQLHKASEHQNGEGQKLKPSSSLPESRNFFRSCP